MITGAFFEVMTATPCDNDIVFHTAELSVSKQSGKSLWLSRNKLEMEGASGVYFRDLLLQRIDLFR